MAEKNPKENNVEETIEERMGKIIGNTIENTVTNIPQIAAKKIWQYLSEVSKNQEKGFCKDLWEPATTMYRKRLGPRIISKYYLIPKQTTK